MRVNYHEQVESVLVVNEQNELKGLITVKDILA